MSKFSVKKPLTIFVAVIAVLVLGVVAYLKMTPDLLPNMDFPYVMIMTTYPGASPEKVEAEVTKPLEQTMSTLEHIKEVTSTSSENYSMVVLEFEESVDLDTIGVDIQQNITALDAAWDDMVGTPYVMKINPSMLPVEVAAVSMEGMDTVQLTQFLNDTLLNKLEGVPGVAQISTEGMVEQQLHVILDQQMLDALNEKIAAAINGELDEAAAELTEKKQELEDAKAKMDSAKAQLNAGKNSLSQQLSQGEAELNKKQTELISAKAQLNDQILQLQSAKQQLQSTLTILKAVQSGLAELESQGGAISAELNKLLNLEQTAAYLKQLREQFEQQMEDIRNNPDLTPEAIEEALQELIGSDAYLQMEAAWAQLQAELAAYGLDVESLHTRIQEQQAALEEIRKRLDELENTLAGEGITADSLNSTIAEMEANMKQIDDGISQLQDALEQLDSGMLQLQDAAAMLNVQKTKGLLEYSSAAAELAAGNATISGALTQIEGGLDTLESSREDALKKADLNNIITMDMVQSILTAQNFAMPAGYLEEDGISYMVSVGEEIREYDKVKGLLLFDMKMDGLDPIYLSDVAQVFLSDNRDESYAKLDGKDSIVLTFEKQSTYATAETTNNINARFRELEEEYPGLRFVALMNQGDYIYLIVDTIMNSLLVGAVFAIIVLFLFLRDIRPTFITLCSIPISVIFAIVLMYFSGVTINMISLSGLAVAVGMLVDNSVVVIENIYRLRSKGANMVQAAVSGAQQVAGAVTASTLTTVCVFAPIVFVEGITKQLFTDLALTMTYALLASLIVSLTLVPAMASGMLRKESKSTGKVMDKFLVVYDKMAAWSLNHKAVVLLSSLALLLLTGWASLSRGFIFMPPMDMPNINVTISMPEGTTMEEARDMADDVLSRIDMVEGIATAGAMMNSSGSALTVSGVSYNVTVYINLEDQSASGAEVGAKIEELCADMPCTVSASSAMMDMGALTGSGVSLRIYGEDMEDLQNAAKTAASVLSGIEGIGEVSDGLEDAAPALHVAIDPNDAMAKGITVAQVYMELASALTNETTAATLDLGGTSTNVIIEKPAGAKLDLESLKAFPLEVTGTDGTVTTFPLSDIATIEETSSLASISRIAQRRYLSVSAKALPGHNVTLLTADAEKAMAKADLGDGITYVFSGENETIMEAVEQLMLMLLLGVLLVYLVMVAQFQSLKSPFIVMFTIPLAFTGGFIALLVCGMEVSVVSLIGFIMLVGIIVNNGIVLVDYINQLRLEGMERKEAILDAGRTRMRPILMTSITTILGLIDMALSNNAGTALMRPVAVVCIGGLLYATLMTLFVVPCIYDIVARKELRSVRDEDLKLLDL